MRWQPSEGGFRFDGLSGSELPRQWLDVDTRVEGVSGAVMLTLGPEPIIGPQELSLISSRSPGKSVRLATDGVRPFALQVARP